MGNIFTRLLMRNMCAYPSNIVMLGLDDSGKTTLLYKLKLGKVTQSIPTIGFNVETIEHKTFRMTVLDVGGGERIRKLWKHYYGTASGIIFVVDSCDEDRLGIAKEELFNVLHDVTDNVFLIVLANKQDLPTALSISDISSKLHLADIKNRRWHIEATSATTGLGLTKSLDWISAARRSPKN